MLKRYELKLMKGLRYTHTMSKLCQNPLKDFRHMTGDQNLLQATGLIYQSSSGVYVTSHLATRVLDKIGNIIKKHMEKSEVDAVRLSLPLIHPSSMWKATGRWQEISDELFRLKDRRGTEYCLAPTHEEMATSYVASQLQTYKQLPWRIYQIDRKFRDELRPTGGMFRAREFLMKDLYSFDKTEEEATLFYSAMQSAYLDIFKEIGIDAHLVIADSGSMGGKTSHEIVAPSQFGKDVVGTCPNCKESKFLSDEDAKTCAVCSSDLETWTGVELGHLFMLPDKYSKALGCFFRNSNDKKVQPVMSCYGIGLSRILATLSDLYKDKEGFKFPKAVVPYTIAITHYGDKKTNAQLLPFCTSMREKLVGRFPQLSEEILVDDRNNLTGPQRIQDIRATGYPMLIGFGRESLRENELTFEVRFRNDREVHILKMDDFDGLCNLLTSNKII